MRALICLSLFTVACNKDAPVETAAPVDSAGGADTADPSVDGPRECGHTFRYAATYKAGAVYVAGGFNDWSDEADPMEEVEPGVWELHLDLDPGVYTYKFVEKTGEVYWVCDPEADYFQCDAGYDAGQWSDCTAGASSCNSMLVVEDCQAPLLHLTGLEIDRAQGAIRAEVTYQPGGGGAALADYSVTIDGADAGAAWGEDGALSVSIDGLAPGRHALRVAASDAEGRAAEPLYVPAWTDDRGWETGLLYYVFVDRFQNGDAGNDGSEGTTHDITDYLGGDWAGVMGKLDYLDGLGVTALWLTAPVDNAAGAWGSDCGADYSGYHGYWPSSAFDVEGHFGTDAEFRALVDAAHDRGMRVLVDWVGNHVHQDHPYFTDHRGWFADEPAICDDYNNWNDIPETCWFDAFLPDVNYYDPEPLHQMVDDAIAWAVDYELDGFRVDAVKHMPRPVYYNMQSRVRASIEHSDVGGDEDFYTVGETFDGDRGLLASYIGEDMLDAQFDFPLYFTLRSALIYSSSTLPELEASWADSAASFGGAVMSTFVGNHDVERFISVAAEGERGQCDESGALHSAAQPPGWDWPYDRLKLGWTWLLTHGGLPLVYYGDEVGLPGYADPDNRQLMRFEGALSGAEQGVLDHLRALGQARRDHPVLALGEATTWWEEDWVYARALQLDGAWALVVINATDDERTLTNGLAWAGMPEGSWRDVVSGEVLSASGDSLSVAVAGQGSRVLIAQSSGAAAAWDAHEYVAGSGDLDACNGMIRADGSYAYYATDTFPYLLSCYRGEADAPVMAGP